MVKKNKIKSIFSKELQCIKDKDLQEKVISIWKYEADQGKWKTIDKVPLEILFKILENYKIIQKG